MSSQTKRGSIRNAGRDRLVESATKQKILEAADKLFYRQGIHATGVNAIITRAGIAKASFYHHFPSKDDLVLAWLLRPETRWLDRFKAEIDRRTRSPERKLLTFFDVLGDWFRSPDFRGCPFFNVAIEIVDEKDATRRVVHEYTLEIQEFFRRNAGAAGLSEPNKLAAQLFVLVPGAIMLATVRRSPDPAVVARAAAKRLLALARRS